MFDQVLADNRNWGSVYLMGPNTLLTRLPEIK